jgi:hypothetical protein
MRWMTGWTSRLAQAAAAAAALTTELITQATAQIDKRTGLHLDDRNPAAFYKDHPGDGSNNATVGARSRRCRHRRPTTALPRGDDHD